MIKRNVLPPVERDPAAVPRTATDAGRRASYAAMTKVELLVHRRAHALGAGHRRNDSKINRSSVTSAPCAAAAAATAAAAIAGFHPSAVSAAFAWVCRSAASSLLDRRTTTTSSVTEVVTSAAP